jgi:regulator of RNase E activity RraB
MRMAHNTDIVAKFIPVTKSEADIIRYLLLERIVVIMEVMIASKSAMNGKISDEQRSKLPKELEKFTDEDIANQYDHWEGMLKDLNDLADRFSPDGFKSEDPSTNSVEEE